MVVPLHHTQFTYPGWLFPDNNSIQIEYCDRGIYQYCRWNWEFFSSRIIENMVIILCDYNARSGKHFCNAPIILSTDYEFVKWCLEHKISQFCITSVYVLNITVIFYYRSLAEMMALISHRVFVYKIIIFNNVLLFIHVLTSMMVYSNHRWICDISEQLHTVIDGIIFSCMAASQHGDPNLQLHKNEGQQQWQKNSFSYYLLCSWRWLNTLASKWQVFHLFVSIHDTGVTEFLKSDIRNTIDMLGSLFNTIDIWK